MMRKLRNVSGVIALFLIALAIGIYVGGQLSYAAEETKEMQWYPNFGGKMMDKARSLDSKSDESAGWLVETDWMLVQVHKHLVKGEKVMQFALTDNEGNILETSKYHLYIRGYDPEGDLSWCQDIPPIITWP